MADVTNNSVTPEAENSGALTPADEIFEAELTGPVKPVIQTAPLVEKTIVQATATPAPQVQAQAPAPSKVYKFVKNMSPGTPVDVGLSEPIKFHRPRKQDGRWSSSGEFRTRDANVAEALRKVAAASPQHYIFEVK